MGRTPKSKSRFYFDCFPLRGAIRGQGAVHGLILPPLLSFISQGPTPRTQIQILVPRREGKTHFLQSNTIPYCTSTVQKGRKSEGRLCLFQRVAVLMNDFQVIRYPSIGENESVTNVVSRDISLVNSIFNGPPRSHECKNRWIPFFENWLELGQERAEFLNILRVVWADPVNQE